MGWRVGGGGEGRGRAAGGDAHAFNFRAKRAHPPLVGGVRLGVLGPPWWACRGGKGKNLCRQRGRHHVPLAAWCCVAAARRSRMTAAGRQEQPIHAHRCRCRRNATPSRRKGAAAGRGGGGRPSPLRTRMCVVDRYRRAAGEGAPSRPLSVPPLSALVVQMGAGRRSHPPSLWRRTQRWTLLARSLWGSPVWIRGVVALRRRRHNGAPPSPPPRVATRLGVATCPSRVSAGNGWVGVEVVVVVLVGAREETTPALTRGSVVGVAATTTTGTPLGGTPRGRAWRQRRPSRRRRRRPAGRRSPRRVAVAPTVALGGRGPAFGGRRDAGCSLP